MKTSFPRHFMAIFLGLAIHAQVAQAEVIEETVRDALLGRVPATDDHDINRDGAVDVTDVVRLARLGSMAEFTSASTVAQESTGVVTLTLAFSKPITGYIQFDVTGTATAGVDYRAVTGNLYVNGTSASLSFTLREDTVIEPVETIIVTLKAPAAGGPAFYLGTQCSHTILIEDNESRWDGWLERDGVQMPLSLLLTQNGTQYQATLTTDGGMALPAGTWPVTNLAVASNSFAGDVGPVTVAAADTALQTDISRTLRLAATPATVPAHKVDFTTGEIAGTYRDEWTMSGTNTSQWNRTGGNAVQGTFRLQRATVAPPLTDPKLTTAP